MTSHKRIADDQLDELVRAALTAPIGEPTHEPAPRGRRLWLGVGALAGGAALALAILPMVLSTPPEPAVQALPIDPAQPTALAGAHSQPDLQPDDVPPSMLVLGRLTITRPLAPRTPTPTPAQARADEPAAISDDLARALRHGDVSEAIALIESTDEADQLESTTALGEAIRSADAARAVLDGLDPDAQLRVVRVWVRSPHLRPVAFDRLAQLARRPELHERVVALADELRSEPDLNAWIASTRLSLNTP